MNRLGEVYAPAPAPSSLAPRYAAPLRATYHHADYFRRRQKCTLPLDITPHADNAYHLIKRLQFYFCILPTRHIARLISTTILVECRRASHEMPTSLAG